MRVGLLTGGGDAPGLNAVIRACVKTLKNCEEDVVVYGFRDGFKGLVTKNYFELYEGSASGILHLGGTILGTTNRDNPFAFNENGIISDKSGVVLEVYKDLNLDCLVVIGGDGTLRIAHELSQLGINVIGVPKTIDNDLVLTDMTFGFMSAVAVATDALDRLHTTAESHHRISILETMGRDAGWIALYAGVAGGADVILIPEIPYNLASICKKIENRRHQGKKFSLIIMAEGAVEQNVSQQAEKGKRGFLLQEDLEREGIETRCTVLGHLQRGGSPVSYDRIIATEYGFEAAKLVLKKDYNRMVSLKGSEIISVPLEKVSGVTKQVPLDHNLILASRSLGISFGDEVL
jgi:phosphofructokinase-like protein